MTKEKREVDELGNITHYDENGAFIGIEQNSSTECIDQTIYKICRRVLGKEG